jgi:hypothetical protein
VAQNVHFRHEAEKENNRYGNQDQAHFAIVLFLFWSRHLKVNFDLLL